MKNEKQTFHDQGRRDFMKQSGLLAGGLLAMPVLSHANYFSGAKDTIKIALIGCGGRWNRRRYASIKHKRKCRAGGYGRCLCRPAER